MATEYQHVMILLGAFFSDLKQRGAAVSNPNFLTKSSIWPTIVAMTSHLLKIFVKSLSM